MDIIDDPLKAMGDYAEEQFAIAHRLSAELAAFSFAIVDFSAGSDYVDPFDWTTV